MLSFFAGPCSCRPLLLSQHTHLCARLLHSVYVQNVPRSLLWLCERKPRRVNLPRRTKQTKVVPRMLYSGFSPAMPDADGNASHPPHESAAPRLPLGEGASSASAALPAAAPRPRHPLHPVAGVVGVFVCGLVAFLTLYATQPLLP